MPTRARTQVSSLLLGKESMIYKCGKTRYSFMWRQAELRALLEHGFSLEEVELLADHSIRFMHICRAASQVHCVCVHKITGLGLPASQVVWLVG